MTQRISRALLGALLLIGTARADDLPKALIIGDSISIGYTKPVQQVLAGQVDVRRIPTNGGPTTKGLAQIDAWLGDEDWDVIHFNWGLHDLCYRRKLDNGKTVRDKVNGRLSTTLEEYEANVRALVTRLEKTGAALIWATTTPVPEGEDGRFVGDDDTYNAAAAKVMREHGIAVNDLHARMKPHMSQYAAGVGNVHFTKEGSAFLAEAVAAHILAAARGEQGRVMVGAIRWDAWHGDASEVGLIVEKTLAPAHWHYRLPFYGKKTGENRVEARGHTQEVMDQEIVYAHEGGLDYWAFVVYPEDNALSLGLERYLSSAKKGLVKFCLNLQGGWEGGGGMDAWPAKVRRYAAYFNDPDYQCVLRRRPLVFLYSVEGLVGPGQFASWDEARAAFDQLRGAAQAAGAGNPYIVAQGWSPEQLAKLSGLLGLDAVGAYASNANGKAAPYAALAAHTERWWDAFKATGCEVVPLATAGWDMRPRVETPVPWVKGGDITCYYEAPTPRELAAHVGKAVQWCRTHPTAAKAQALLIYAWNEFDEGGWLCPTLDEGTARLDALRRVLRPAQAKAPAGA